MPDSANGKAAFLVFSDDWGRHPSSCQHLIGRLLSRHAVSWVNTIGMRTPRLNWSTVTRGLEKIRQWTRPAKAAKSLPPNLRVCNPRMWPWFSSALDRRMNRGLLTRQLAPILNAMPAPPVAITTLPIVADLMDVLPVQRWVYYCVDDFAQWPGLDQGPLRRMEEQLVKRAEVVVAVSENLRQRLAGMGRASHLLTHGVDLEVWTPADAGPSLPELAGLQRPLIVFWGVVDRRMDVAFVRRLADDLTEGTIVLLGPDQDSDPALVQSPRVVRLPPMNFELLPYVARQAAVLVMPYADLPVTRAIQPLKLKEYLATGKPTVVRDLPANREWADCLDLADTAQAFSEAVRSRIQTGLPDDQRRARSRLAAESWDEKAQLLEQWALHREPMAHAACCS